jgi:eukaryotic-like serine/threonine-protein kinase
MTAPRTATCPTCSTVVADSDRFCKSCGTVVSGISASLPIGGASFGPAAAAAPEGVPLGAASPWELVLARLRSVTSGEFEIGRELGRGGMAAVFLAQDLALNRRVAIKVMAPGLMLGEGMVQRFRQEAITVANLSHAHIVTIHAVRQLQDLHFFVMQFVEGQSLEAVLRAHGPLPLEVVRVILHHVGSALAYAHRRGVVHRDIKPGNILLSGDGDALVTDFGIAKVAEGPTQTQTGMVVGTPTYMSPEQCYAQELDGSSDQYSLGIVAYQMLTGHVPFSGAAFEIMKGHTTDPVPPMRAVRPDIPESVDDAVRRMLAKTPGERFASFSHALGALGAHDIGEDSPLRAELVRLAAVEERREQLAELLRTPSTPVSGSRRRTSGATPAATPAPLTPAPATPAPPAPMASSLVISAVPTTVRVGDAFRVHATPLDASGHPVARTVRWSAVGTAVEVTPDGAVRALTSGRAAVMASCDEVYETVVVSVLPSAAASGADLALPSAAGAVPVDTAMPMNATAVLSGGLGAPPHTPAPPNAATTVPPVAAASGATAGATPSAAQSSAATASAPSTPTATARPPWVYAAAALPVLLIAYLVFKPGADERPTPPQPASGETVTAPTTEPLAQTADGETATDEVTPDEPAPPPTSEAATPVLSLRFVTPGSTSLRVAERLTLRVTARDETTGSAMALPRLRFTSSDRSVARVDNASGEVTAVSPGRATITADAGDAKASLPLTIVAATPLVAQSEPTREAPAPVQQPPQQQPQQQPTVPPPGNPAPVAVTPPAQTPPVSAAASPAELEAQARTVITAYARAYESRELDRVRAVWPGLTDGYAAELNTFFDLARDVRVTIRGVDASAGYDASSGAITRVIARVNIRFNDGRRGQSQDDRWAVSLRRDGSAWRIVSVGPP